MKEIGGGLRGHAKPPPIQETIMGCWVDLAFITSERVSVVVKGVR